jgi:hypothetical protein
MNSSLFSLLFCFSLHTYLSCVGCLPVQYDAVGRLVEVKGDPTVWPTLLELVNVTRSQNTTLRLTTYVVADINFGFDLFGYLPDVYIDFFTHDKLLCYLKVRSAQLTRGRTQENLRPTHPY